MINERLVQLRQIMNESGADYYFVPSVDPHRDEYVPLHWQRRPFISGFTGSAGDALIGLNQAYLWTDPRYFLQADLELDSSLYQVIKMGQGESPSISQWLKNQKDGLVFAVDPKVININLAKKIRSAVKAKGGKILYVDENWIDQIWQDQPPLPQTPIHLHEVKDAGLSASEKLNLIRSDLKQKNADALVLNSLEAICWLLNIRGNDIAYNPMVICNAIVAKDFVTLFVDADKITPEVKAYFKKENINVQAYNKFGQALQSLKGLVWCDPNNCNHWIEKQIQTDILYTNSPINLLKSIKNSVEQQGMIEAHIQDAVAEIKFLHWLENHWADGITEVSAHKKLDSLRLENPSCVDLSFNTISGFGPHGAIIHYAVTDETDITIDDSSLYLVDSGGQYPMGTTDITRTIHLGTPTKEQKHHYTLVLKGHLALSGLVFPDGTCGEDINAFAHAPLWKEGLDYGHGTGHGVGCYSCVHQFPPVISNRKSNWAFKPGMVVSNEPGVYLQGRYGIRIENLVLVTKALTRDQSLTDNGPFYQFEDLTLVPYARNLINTDELNANEIEQINRYHQRVYKTIAPRLEDPALVEWLKAATAPL